MALEIGPGDARHPVGLIPREVRTGSDARQGLFAVIGALFNVRNGMRLTARRAKDVPRSVVCGD